MRQYLSTTTPLGYRNFQVYNLYNNYDGVLKITAVAAEGGG